MDETNFKHTGVQNDTFGLYSLQKGSAAFGASGSTLTPSMVEICNRAEWKMGRIRDKYIKFKNIGDQYLGQLVAGLDAHSPSFAYTPSSFEAKDYIGKNWMIA